MAGLTDFDVAVDAVGRKADLANLPAKWLTNGFFTITFPDGSHRTFRIRTEPNGALKGKRTLGLLIGPDNTDEYESFAFIEDAGLSVWKRFAKHKQADHAAVLWALAKGEVIEGYELLISKRCLACNRPLTTADSIKLGYGPHCAERLGLKL
jgi:hypothetical protein